MVYLSRIYTKTGDKGDTALGDGTRVGKDHPRVAAFGSVDELNSVLGLLLAHQADLPEAELLRSIQNELFDVGADLCAPLPPKGEVDQRLRIQASQAERLEKAIDRLNASLQPLKSFVLPGGSIGAAWCHLARTVHCVSPGGTRGGSPGAERAGESAGDHLLEPAIGFAVRLGASS
jgi:cob(I)alamin adenosyltransferase